MLIEASHPLTVRRSSGELRLVPGYPVELPDGEAIRLLEKANGKVRAITPPVIEPAAQNARPIYWETGDGRILGPAVPELLAQVGSEFWIVTTFEGYPRWINADRLRSRKAFEEQAACREVEPIRF